MLVNLTIDGKDVKVEHGTSILNAAKSVGIEIPTLCYLEKLEVVSSCRMCVVEVEGWNKPVTACSIPVAEGMVVATKTDKIVNYRRELLRLYLDNHPNDCLTCQKAGECELQNYAYEYGVTFREHDGARRDFKQAKFSDTSSPYILRDESKCILCGRCVRTCAKVDRNVLSFAERGFDTRIVADASMTLEESSCVSCNRCVAACPVGALMDRRAQFEVRNWNAKKEVVKCKRCNYGCDMEVLYNEDDKAVAVRAIGADGDERPLCLTGRLTTEFEHVDKAKEPYEKVETPEGNKFVKTTWVEAMKLGNIYEKLKAEEANEEAK